jgi:hypothetical protein
LSRRQPHTDRKACSNQASDHCPCPLVLRAIQADGSLLPAGVELDEGTDGDSSQRVGAGQVRSDDQKSFPWWPLLPRQIAKRRLPALIAAESDHVYRHRFAGVSTPFIGHSQVLL